MATKKATALPEITISTGPIADFAKSACIARAKVSEAQNEEDTAKKSLVTEAEMWRENKEQAGEYIGLIRVIQEDCPSVRVEFKISNGAITEDQLPELDRVFGSVRPLLFEKAVAITEITDPVELIDSLSSKGLNPWDYLQVSVRTGHDEIIAQHKGVITDTALLPKKGFLATLNDVAKSLTDEAKAYVKAYLKASLKPTVPLTSKGLTKDA
jgi:hypothetical protein